MKKVFTDYLRSIAEIAQRGDAREESFYSALQSLLENVAQQQGRAVQVTVLPKKTEGGSPDFRIWDGSHQVIGYIEAKFPGSRLDQIENSEQLQRYRHTFPNLILTDFFEFRLYRHGEEVRRALLGRPFIAQTLKKTPPAENVGDMNDLVAAFLSFALPPSLTPEELSRELARRTRFLRDEVILPELCGEVAAENGPLYGFYDAFRKYLVAGLSERQFADLYAQTITYGLFAARTRAKGAFNRQAAFNLIPSTIGILRDVFQFISLGKPSPQMEVVVDDIAAVLNAADVQAILAQYYRQGKGDDPILHFYETFLAEYDPETRERRGVYYTPQPVVRYIVRAVHHVLKSRFGLADGLADENVTVLDPAAGTLTFPAEAVRVAFEEFTDKYGEGAKDTFLRRHILPHFYAFELLMAPYAVGHMKIGFLLDSLGVPLQNGERFQFYLTNTLEMEDLEQIAIPGLASLSQESHEAAKVKKDQPILVIMGNPPYSGISANTNDWTEQLLKTDYDGIQSYYTVDGKPLGEKNPKWLQDDYVKFLRFAQWKIHKGGRGIVAMITNHSYLDNPTFRGMRQSLLKTFDEIYILDLHGNSLKRETAPDGGPDENVFDIRQGVAIALFIKYGEQSHGPAHEYHWQTPAHLYEHLGPQAREMRKNPTPAEEALWQRLRQEQLGVKFRRQHCIDRFIVDFYAREPRLIVEVDGPIHESQKEYDAARQAFLESLGYRVLRFTNDRVLNDMEGVVREIQEAVRPHPLAPSPQAGKGDCLSLTAADSPGLTPATPNDALPTSGYSSAPSFAPQNDPLPTTADSPGLSSATQNDAIPTEADSPAPSSGRGPGGGVYHADLYGTRLSKYDWLNQHDLSNTPWQPLTPQSPYYFFIPRSTTNLQAYQSWQRITEIFPLNGVGMTTARDHFVIDFDAKKLLNRVRSFKYSNLNDKELHQAFRINVKKGWSIRKAWQKLQEIDDHDLQNYVKPVLYRPFDVRYIFYHDAVVWRTVKRVMHHMLAGKNVALVMPRRVEHVGAWQHIFIADRLVEHVAVSLKTIDYCFPLYLYPSETAPDMLRQTKEPNLAEWLLPQLAAAYGFTPTPEQVMAYIYAVLYSPTYRQKYAEELRIDFPHVPFTADADIFRQMASLGQELMDLHLLRKVPAQAGVKYQGQGSDRIEFVRYDAARGRVAINKDKYFEGITPEMWEYRIGGYQVLEKYLKDRKGRDMDDPVRYIRIAEAIARTMDIQQQIDQVYPGVESKVLSLGRGCKNSCG